MLPSLALSINIAFVQGLVSSSGLARLSKIVSSPTLCGDGLLRLSTELICTNSQKSFVQLPVWNRYHKTIEFTHDNIVQANLPAR